jgi:hypothetical protein
VPGTSLQKSKIIINNGSVKVGFKQGRIVCFPVSTKKIGNAIEFTDALVY